MRGSAWCQEDFTAGGVAALSLVHGIVPCWLLQCMAWYGVGALVKPTAATIRRLCLRPVTWWEPEHHRRRPLPRLPTTHTTTHKRQSAQSASVHYPKYGESSTHPSAASRPQDSPIWNHSLATVVFCMSFPCMRAFDFLQLIIFTNHCRKPKQTQRCLFIPLSFLLFNSLSNH